jgi:hypothetical protein
MECTIKWLDGMSFIAETGTGHLVAMDGAPDAGGRVTWLRGRWSCCWPGPAAAPRSTSC